MSKTTFKRYVGLLLIGEEGKRHYVFIEEFITFMYNHTIQILEENIFVVIVYSLLVL